MNIALFAISTFIVIICIGIPVAKHPHWFNTYEEQVQAAKDKGYYAMATPVKIRNLPHDSSEPTYKNYNYSVVYQFEFEGRIYTKRRQQNDYPEPRMFYFPSGNPKRAFCCREDQPMTIGSWIPVLCLLQSASYIEFYLYLHKGLSGYSTCGLFAASVILARATSMMKMA